MNQLALELFSKEELQTTNGVNGNGHAKSKSFTLAGGKVQVITLPTKPPNIFKTRPEPQKSRSLQRLVDKGNPPYQQVDTVIIRPEERPYVPFTSTKYFVRPCPMNPNHGADVGGFYSEVVSRKDLSQYIHEMRLELAKSAPDAAIIIQPYIEARMSAVVAPGQYMVIGGGHDGVTAGHGRQYGSGPVISNR